MGDVGEVDDVDDVEDVEVDVDDDDDDAGDGDGDDGDGDDDDDDERCCVSGGDGNAVDTNNLDDDKTGMTRSTRRTRTATMAITLPIMAVENTLVAGMVLRFVLTCTLSITDAEGRDR